MGLIPRCLEGTGGRVSAGATMNRRCTKGARSKMGAGDIVSNKIDDLGGKAKEAAGKVTNDKSTENEGKLDQAKSSLKDAGEKVKDAFKK